MQPQPLPHTHHLPHTSQPNFTDLTPLLSDSSETNITQPRVPDDVWLSAPLETSEPEGMDERQIWGDALGAGHVGASGVESNGAQGGTGDVPSGGMYGESHNSLYQPFLSYPWEEVVLTLCSIRSNGRGRRIPHVRLDVR